MNIETATEQDIDGIIAVEEKSWVEIYPNQAEGITVEDVKARFNPDFYEKRRSEIVEELKDPNFRYRVVKSDNQIVGYTRGLLGDTYNDLVEIYLSPDTHGQGVGKALLEDILTWFGDEKPVRLGVAKYNKAIGFYQHFGFKTCPDLQQSPEEDWNILPSGIRIPIIFMEK